jgi:L-aminoadipate-semialdehyde dehydrogenase
MPLNPNGKIDKPALPFPDTVQAGSAVPPPHTASPTEEAMRKIWASILPNPPHPIPSDESFFDLGGHSILATRLIFEIRKVFLVNAPLGLIFQQPTLAGLAGEVESFRNADLGLYNGTPIQQPVASASLTVPGPHVKTPSVTPVDYGQDYVNLLPRLHESYPPIPADFNDRSLCVFLTGATGFLGAFILRDLLSRKDRVKKVICLVRASDAQKALQRLREALGDRNVWDEEWADSQRLEVVAGDLSQTLFGFGAQQWAHITGEVDVILHNGALVRSKNCSVFSKSERSVPPRSIGFIHTKGFGLLTCCLR